MIVDSDSHWVRPDDTIGRIEVCIKMQWSLPVQQSMNDSLTSFARWHEEHGIEPLCYNGTKTNEGFDDRRYFRFFFEKEEHAVEFKLRFSE
jgi:hypothetical protein